MFSMGRWGASEGARAGCHVTRGRRNSMPHPHPHPFPPLEGEGILRSVMPVVMMMVMTIVVIVVIVLAPAQPPGRAIVGIARQEVARCRLRDEPIRILLQQEPPVHFLL